MKYIKIPKEMFENPEYKKLSANAKLLYGLLLDRQSLSKKNNLTDADGEIVVYFKRNEAGKLLNLSVRSIQKVYEELKNIGLLREKSQGIGKAYLLYVKIFSHRCTKTSVTDVQKLPTNKTELNKTDINKTDLNKIDRYYNKDFPDIDYDTEDRPF